MNDLAKVKPNHIQRTAFVYIRQSSPAQVEYNRESTVRQYALREKAQELGWAKEQVIVIDEDLGLSGSGFAERSGFARLTAEVALGHVVWRLGQDGDFTVDSTDPDPWFSHQHNAHYVDDSTLVLFDNGNTRRTRDPNADSRGQVWRLDEQTMTATLVFNVDLGNYSLALGSAEQLSNGNFSFTSGRQGTPPNLFGQTIEVLPDGTQTYVLEVAHQEFRSYRIRSLYEGTNDFSANGGGGAPSGRQPPVAPQRQGLPPEVFGFSLGQEIATQRQATGTLHPPATAQLIEGFELARSQSGLEPSRLLGFPVLGHARRPYTGAGAAPRRMPAEGYWELLADLFADSNLLALTTEAI